MSHATIADRRWINLQKITPDGLVIWSRSIMPSNWPTRREQRPDSGPFLADCCGNEHYWANNKTSSSHAIEVQPTPDGGVLILVIRDYYSGESEAPCM